MAHLTAQGLLDLVLDGSFESWDKPATTPGSTVYQQELGGGRAGRHRQSVLTGRGLMHGRPVAVLVNEFRFLAGSIGQAAAERIVSAVRRATAEGIPLLATTASGGPVCRRARPRSCTWSTSRARSWTTARRACHTSSSADPTTGGVFASWGSLAHVTVAERGAHRLPRAQGLRADGGPAVPAQRADRREPRRSRHHRRRRAARRAAAPGRPGAQPADDPPLPQTRELRTGEVTRKRSAWESIQITRGRQRAGVREVCGTAATRRCACRARRRASATAR